MLSGLLPYVQSGLLLSVLPDLSQHRQKKTQGINPVSGYSQKKQEFKNSTRPGTCGTLNHLASLFPKWMRATKPGPVWAPITGPMDSWWMTALGLILTTSSAIFCPLSGQLALTT